MKKLYLKSISIILMLFCVVAAVAQQADSVKAGRFIDAKKGKVLTGLENVPFVMKGGGVYKDELHK